MTSELDMTGIDEERIRRFVREGKTMNEEEITHFLDTPCFELTLQNFPLVLATPLSQSDVVQGCLLAGVNLSPEVGTCNIKIWVPASHQPQLMEEIRDLFAAEKMDNPYELLDFENMDKAGPGRNYVVAMLICARDDGQDIS